MITIRPAERALTPVSSQAAQAVSAPNYDEFQSDLEVWEIIQNTPDCVLGITMPHCNVPSADKILPEGGPEALSVAKQSMANLKRSPLTREVESVLWVYEIADRPPSSMRRIGLGAMGQVDQIRRPEVPDGSIIRNEGVRLPKVHGRADLIRASSAIIGNVNIAVDDEDGGIASLCRACADARPSDYEAKDADGNTHRIWLVTEPEQIEAFVARFAAEPRGYVADGNHRSAAAAHLGLKEFSAVFFPAAAMSLAPYNRLIKIEPLDSDTLQRALSESFDVEKLTDQRPFQPREIHEIGLYADAAWYRLVPRAHTYDPADAAESIDADIVQRHLFERVFGISDARDARLTFVGGNRDAAWLQARVDEGGHTHAVTLAPVQMKQFIDVCRQGKMMPPKSTWFQPKIRSGLVIPLLSNI